MRFFKKFNIRFPYWTYLLVLLAAVINTMYFVFNKQVTCDGQSNQWVNGHYIIDHITPGGAAEKAGMQSGDILMTLDSMEVHEWLSVYQGKTVGDTCLYGVIREGEAIEFPLVFTSYMTFYPVFFIVIYSIILLLTLASLYLPYKKPSDQAVKLFFIYIQLFAVTQNAKYLTLREPLAMAATFFFLGSSCLLGPLLIHFHLLFPKHSKVYGRFNKWIKWFYITGILFTLGWFVSYIFMVMYEFPIWKFVIITRISLSWMVSTYFLAVGIVILQFISIKETFARNQLRLVILGSFFGIYTAIPLIFFYDFIQQVSAKYPYLIYILQGIGSLIMISCILIAIFRYRIWDIEIFIRKALLYLSATMIIIFSYLLLIFLVDQYIAKETDITRFLTFAAAVSIFLVLRDGLQRMVDKVFHRETYDLATVVTNFEGKLAGVYLANELQQRIVLGLDEIFHFKSLIFYLKKEQLDYEYSFSLGLNLAEVDIVRRVTPEFENRLKKSRVFSPSELDQRPSFLEITNGELIVPLIKEGQPFGFFLCGSKKSEKTYSLQDISVLSLIAKRVIALFHTASLYQKDLDRQLMLERERARISQDMHDDIGASLSRISMMSDLVKNIPGIVGEAKPWLSQISDTSRGVTEEMNQIIWALNPRNDTLDGLVSYIRRFAYEYLDPTTVCCIFDLPMEPPNLELSVEVRRNVYLVVREALHNVVKHARASKVWINLEMDEHRFSIRMMDDGKGFDPGKIEFPGNGLINMKKRMNDVGGALTINSSIGKGTEIVLEVNITK